MASKTKVKNITNGEVHLTIDDDDIARTDMAIMRVPGGDIYETVKDKDSTTATNYYI